MVVAKSDIQKVQRGTESADMQASDDADMVSAGDGMRLTQAATWPSLESLPEHFDQWQGLIRRTSRYIARRTLVDSLDLPLACLISMQGIAVLISRFVSNPLALSVSLLSLLSFTIWTYWYLRAKNDLLGAARILDRYYRLEGRLVNYVTEVWRPHDKLGPAQGGALSSNNYLLLAMRETATHSHKLKIVPVLERRRSSWKFALLAVLTQAFVFGLNLPEARVVSNQEVANKPQEKWLSTDTSSLIREDLEQAKRFLKSRSALVILDALFLLETQLRSGEMTRDMALRRLAKMEEAIVLGRQFNASRANADESQPSNNSLGGISAASRLELSIALERLAQSLSQEAETMSPQEFNALRAELQTLSAEVKKRAAARMVSPSSNDSKANKRRYAEVLGRQKKKAEVTRLDLALEKALQGLRQLQAERESKFLQQPTASASSEMNEQEKSLLLEQVLRLKERLTEALGPSSVQKRRRKFLKRAVGSQGMGGSGSRGSPRSHSAGSSKASPSNSSSGSNESVNSADQPGHKAGQGHDGDIFSDSEAKDQFDEQMKAAVAQDSQDGPSESEIIRSAAELGFDRPEYKSLYREYRQVAEDVLDDEVPRSKQKEVTKYFELIRPR